MCEMQDSCLGFYKNVNVMKVKSRVIIDERSFRRYDTMILGIHLCTCVWVSVYTAWFLIECWTIGVIWIWAIVYQYYCTTNNILSIIMSWFYRRLFVLRDTCWSVITSVISFQMAQKYICMYVCLYVCIYLQSLYLYLSVQTERQSKCTKMLITSESKSGVENHFL